jgi:putative oxidoreductase
MTFKNRTDLGLLLLRVLAGGMMVWLHGWPKLLRLAAGDISGFPDPIGLGPAISLVLAVLAEFVFALLLVAGWWTRWSLVPLIITMAVAAFVHHGPDPLKEKEKALLFLGMYLVLFLTGPGWYSLDKQWKR